MLCSVICGSRPQAGALLTIPSLHPGAFMSSDAIIERPVLRAAWSESAVERHDISVPDIHKGPKIEPGIGRHFEVSRQGASFNRRVPIGGLEYL